MTRLSAFDERVAFQENSYSITYKQLVETVRSLAQTLEAQGIKAGDGILLHGPSNAGLFATTLAGMKLGAIVAPMTDQSPLTSQQAELIMKPQWSCETSGSAVLPVRLEFRREERPRLLNRLSEDHLGGVVLFSSGSSGTPKGILYDEERLLAKFKIQRDPITALSFLMLDHFGGINTVLAVLSSGGKVIVLPDRRVETVCAAVERYQVKVLPVTPTFIKMMLLSRVWANYNMSSLEKITYGTEPMTEIALERLRLAFPKVEFQQTYGLSEVGVLRTKSRPDGSLWMKIGGEGFDIKVIDNVLWIRSAYQMRGYLNASADIDEDGFFNTQDEVLVDGEYVKILGRASDVINVGGEKLYPAEIESCIEMLPEISQVVAYSIPNALVGSAIAVDIATNEEIDAHVLKRLVRQHCQQNLGRAGIPSRIRIVDHITVNGRQKTIRKREVE